MKKSYHILIAVISILSLFFTGCGSTKTMALNSIQLTNQLRPGMTYGEVESILGKPKSTRMTGENLVARWNLQEMWRGYIPYDMVFDPKDQTLISWGENSKAFEQNQAQLKAVADEVTRQTSQNVPGGAGSGSGTPAPDFQNDAALMKYFAGAYYSFSAVGGGQTGGTERKISLCSDGRYSANSESGYSGDGWGSASQGGGGGTWRITGSKASGTIVTTDRNGRSTTYKFEVCGDGCIYFGNSKFAYAGAPECR